MRAEQRHSSKSRQRAYEHRGLRLQRSRGKKFKSILILHWKKKINDDKISLTRKSCFMSLSGRFMLDYEFVRKFGLTFGFNV